MKEGAGTNASHHNGGDDRDGRGGSDRILTAGPSKWEATQTNLVDELRNLLRARDMALAEQRTRHVKESVVIREQRHALATKEPGIAGKLAKLFGWTDAGGSPRSMSPIFVSPVRSRCVSPTGSPANTHRNEGDDLLDGDVGMTALAEHGEEDVVVGGKTLSKRLGLLEAPTVEILGNGAGQSNGKKSHTRTSQSFGIADPVGSLIADSATKAESSKAACPRCTHLHQELETALTDRTLAEAELVSMRRAISQVDTAWECDESSGGAAVPHGPEQEHSMRPEREDDTAGEAVPPVLPGRIDGDLGLRDELGRLEESLASLKDSGVAPPKTDEHVVDDQGLPKLQEFVLQPEDEAIRNKSVSLAASLSATVAGRARNFEELSRRRVLRLGAEADLRQARAKLEILLASVPPASHRLDPATGDDGQQTRRGEENAGERAWHPRYDDNSDNATREEAGGKGEGKGRGSRTPKHQQDVCRSPATNAVSSRKSEGFGARAKGGGKGSQQSGRGEGRSRGNDASAADAPAAASASKRRLLGPKEPARQPQERVVKGRRSPTEDTEAITEPTLSNRKANVGPGNRGQPPITTKEKHSKQRKSANDTTNEPDTATQNLDIDDPKSASLAGGDLQERGGAVTCEEVRHQECQTRKECSAEAFTVEESRVATGGETPSDQRGGETSGETVAKTGMETKTKSSPSSFKRQQTPRSSPRRPKDLPPPPAQPRNPPKSPRGALANGGGASEQSKPKPVSTAVDDSQPKDIGDAGAEDTIGHRHLEATSNVPGEEGVVDETGADGTDILGHADVADARIPNAKEAAKTSTPKKTERRAKVGTKLPRGQVARDPAASKSASRSLGKTTRIKPALRGTRTPPTRLGITTKAKRALVGNSDKDAAGSTSERVSPESATAAGAAEDAQRQEKHDKENPLGGSGAGSAACDSTDVDRAVGDGGAAEDGSVRSSVADEEVAQVQSTTDSTQNEVVCLEMHHAPTVMPTHDAEAVEDDRNRSSGSEEAGKGPTHGCDGRVKAASEPPGTNKNDLLPRDVVDLAEALNVEVDRLRLERAELEDTVAQLNVAAAQLYFVEYEQMKLKCRQLKRVILGPSARPTEQESAYGHSCQEILHRLKVIGVSFFRRRVGGVMGETFFPDGLARTISLIGRKKVEQECQTAPVERLGPLAHGGASPAWPASRDVCVQVAGGIDVEDEPLMEQQVYSLLGKLDLLLKRREEVLRTYHREAEEGAREARALLASAAAQHDPGHAWGVSRPPNIRQLVGGREGPAGAPRPAINPTNLLFTAAVVLDSVATKAAGPTNDPFETPKSTATAGTADHASRRRRFSSAEKALMELADEVVAALEFEQHRSDASAERRRFLMERRNSGRCPGDIQVLGRPPTGVPPLIWAMEIHLVGKLAQAFRIAVEARGFEREVEDANLVAAVSLGRSPPLSTNGGGKNELGHPGHLGHRMMSVLRGDEDEEERRRRQRARGDFENDQEVVASGRGQKPFDWGVDTYSPHGTPRRAKSGAGGNGAPHTNSSRSNSPRRTERLARRELPGRQATTDRPGVRGVYHGSTLRAKPIQQYNDVAGVRRNCPNQQQRELQRQDSAAVARVEAAVFDTVRPSRLHPRPGSASVEGRSGRVGSERTSPSAAAVERHRPRPQSARLAEPDDDFSGHRKIPAAHGPAVGNQNMRGYIQERTSDGRRMYQEAATTTTTGRQHQQQPVRPTITGTASAAIRRPASAGGRVVDTRIWCSNKNVTEPGAGVFRCRPNSAFRAATVRFEGDGVSPAPLVPTHAGEVPEFLRQKERDLIEGNREKWAAVNGRFEVVDDDNEGRASGQEERVEYHRDVGGSKVEANGERQAARTMGSDGWGVERGSPALSSLRLEDSMDGEGLLPDAGEQAFFDAWKPTGYDIDLSRYD